MLETMYVRCAQCGYDNSPEYRFCGMCGGPLPRPVTEIKAPVRDAAPTVVPIPASEPSRTPPPVRDLSGPSPSNRDSIVRGPSFLGLSDESTGDYLDEDEPKRSHAGTIVIVLLLLGAGGYIGWQWRHNGFPFDRLTASNSAPAPSASADAGQTAADQPQGEPAPKPADTSQSPTNAAPAPSAATPPDNSTAPLPTEGEQGSTKEAATPAAAENAPPGPPAEPKKVRPKLAPAHAAISTPIEKPEVATAPDADLEAAGERYLYGTGIPQNCARAESNLRTAATKGNSKAQTVLGTMYATGHCVGKDLPTAYRWFARALHGDPQNSRISDDLQVLWRQMTPQEKQLATVKQ